MLTITLLGQVVIERDGEPVTCFRSNSEIALLVYLAHTGQTYRHPVLAELLWPGRTPKQSLGNLRTVLNRLRGCIGDDLLVSRKTVGFASTTQQQVDSVLLQSQLAEIGIINSAEELLALNDSLQRYRGDFLAGFYLPNAPGFN